MNVAIIGCGLIGTKRARALSTEDHLIVVCDINQERASTLASEFACESTDNWQSVVSRNDVDVVINSSINNVLEPITIAALQAGKHVLCEKPLGRNASESKRMIEAAHASDRKLKTGFNHRFHPAIWKAKSLLEDGVIGECLTIRARYGHGGRPGMENEWRASKELCGGGELLDQGVHVIDLLRWFGGEISEAYAKVETKFWNMEVEDNAFAIMKTRRGVTTSFHVSWTNWKNIFSFEVFGSDGYLAINGLGGSYGTETLEIGRRKKEGGRPDVEAEEFSAEDRSWNDEWENFRTAIITDEEPTGNGVDGHQANRVIEALYRSADMNTTIVLPEELIIQAPSVIHQ